MEFCDKCDNLLIAEKHASKLRYVCKKCKKVFRKKATSTQISETMKSKEKKVQVFKEEDIFMGYPKTKTICPNCDNTEAYWYMQQTRGGDEPPTRFYCCTKCQHKWREY